MKRRYTSYPAELKAHALRLAAESGVNQAAKETGVPLQRVYYWVRKGGVSIKRDRCQSYDSGVRERALVLAKEYGVAAAARKMGISSPASIYQWADEKGVNLRSPVRKTYSSELKEKAVARAAEVGSCQAARELGVKSSASVRSWAKERGVRLKRCTPRRKDRVHYSKAFKARAVDLAVRVGVAEAAKTLGVPWRSTVDKWLRAAGKKAHDPRCPKVYSEEEIQRAIAFSQRIGINPTVKKFRLSSRSVLVRWRKARGYGPLPSGRRSKYSAEFRLHAAMVAKKLGEKRTAGFFAVRPEMVSDWMEKEEELRADLKAQNRSVEHGYWPHDLKVLVVQEAMARDLSEAEVTEAFGIPGRVCLRWKKWMLKERK